VAVSDPAYGDTVHGDTALQRESARVNELGGVQAFLVGAFDEVLRCKTLEEAKTCAELALQSVSEYNAGTWKPGPHDDPANWRAK
jgi:hypothetical protein